MPVTLLCFWTPCNCYVTQFGQRRSISLYGEPSVRELQACCAPPRWIEVKSTSGVDGRFDWSRKEFERALRERDRYELWRVYRVADNTPVAKCFPNPARMLGTRQIALELGMLRANIEKLD
ncbi:DUF3883 domain-containing protein [Paraburkholderia phymatum]|uniref:DUF3883 domain-containing protein n=1 Tax=Paraburkholderia phymatum TaxID=148447 RepID=A0ACC6TSW5_9BURK